MRGIALITVAVLGLPCAAGAADVLLANGSAPPDPANVLADATHVNDHVWVRNVGCPPQGLADPGADCPVPGASTEVAVTAGADVGRLTLRDSSRIEMSGGTVGGGSFGVVLLAGDSASLTVTGGSVNGENLAIRDSAHLTWDGGFTPGTILMFGSSSADIRSGSIATWLDMGGASNVVLSGGSIGNSTFTSGTATLTVRGGSVGTALDVGDSSIVVIEGTGFEVDGSPVPYGTLAATSGILDGVLASGDAFSTEFTQGGGSSTGTIELAPPAATVPASSAPGRAALAACLVGCSLVAFGRAHRSGASRAIGSRSR